MSALPKGPLASEGCSWLSGIDWAADDLGSRWRPKPQPSLTIPMVNIPLEFASG